MDEILKPRDQVANFADAKLGQRFLDGMARAHFLGQDVLARRHEAQALAQAAQQVTGKNLRIKVLEESSIGTLSTKANPVDEVIRRAGELNINVEIND